MARPKGRQTKKKIEFRAALRQYCADLGVDPHYWMADLLTQTAVPVELRFQAAKELAQYLEPKLRSIEVGSDPARPVVMTMEEIISLSDARIMALLRGYQNGHADPVFTAPE